MWSFDILTHQKGCGVYVIKIGVLLQGRLKVKWFGMLYVANFTKIGGWEIVAFLKVCFQQLKHDLETMSNVRFESTK